MERGKKSAMLDDDVMRWVGIGGERGNVGHVGFGWGCDVIIDAQIRGAVNQRVDTGSGSKNVNFFFILLFGIEKRKICLTEFYKRERGPEPSVTAGVPFLSHNKCHRIEKCHTTKQNKTMSQTSCLGFLQFWTDHVP